MLQRLIKVMACFAFCLGSIPIGPSFAYAVGDEIDVSVDDSPSISATNTEDALAGGDVGGEESMSGGKVDAEEVPSEGKTDMSELPSDDSTSNWLDGLLDDGDEGSNAADEDENEGGINALSDSGTLSVASVNGINVISNVNSGKPLDVESASAANGANVQQYTSNNTPAQRFRVEPAGDGVFYLVNVNSGKVLDVANGLKAQGANVQQLARLFLT